MQAKVLVGKFVVNPLVTLVLKLRYQYVENKFFFITVFISRWVGLFVFKVINCFCVSFYIYLDLCRQCRNSFVRIVNINSTNVLRVGSWALLTKLLKLRSISLYWIVSSLFAAVII